MIWTPLELSGHDGTRPDWHKVFSVIILGDTGSSVYRFLNIATLTIVFKPQNQVLVVERDSQTVADMSNLVNEVNKNLL